ncbi:MAG: phosphoadenylyl-sulfate reductase [Parvularculaceae bacterium]|nr:phosphoadenylyl-sulfate reductase [Parvularculaceae bacterium]
MTARVVALRSYAPPLEPASLEAQAAALDAEAQGLSAEAIVARAIEAFPGRIALVSSFGAEAAALLHLVARVDPATPVLFLETGKHFAQTISYREDLARQLGLKDVRDIRPLTEEAARADPKGDLWRRDNDACCALRKVRPLASALSGFDAWFTGRKRVHGGLRAFLPIVEAAPPHIKINPLARWSGEDVEAYAERHALPPHPLVEQGFPSIGCWPCTAPTAKGDDARAGRWRGLSKTECGIHRETVSPRIEETA